MKKILSLIILTVSVLTVSAQVDRSKKPAPGPAPKIEIGKAQKSELPNGLKIILVEDHKLPKISFQLYIDNPTFLEKEKAGLLSLTGSMIKRGSTTKTKAQIDEEIDFVGAYLSFNSRGFYGSSLTKHKDVVLSMASDLVLNPAFNEEEFNKLKKETINGLKASATDPGYAVGNVSAVINYGKDHPYGEIASGDSYEAIQLEDCKNYFNQYFKPNNAYLVIVGDINLEETKTLVNKYFGSWEKGNIPAVEYTKPHRPESNQVAFVNRDGAVQSMIKITYPIDYTPGNPDAIKGRVMNNLLGGGGFSSRMLKNIREDKGYTYGVSSSLRSDDLIGSFGCGGSVANTVTDSTIIEFIYEMRNMVTEKVTELELEVMKNKMMGEFALGLESSQTIASFALSKELNNLPDDYFETYLERLSHINVEDILEVAKKYIHPDNVNIVVVGNKDEVAESLKKFGAITYYDIHGNKAETDEISLPEGLTATKVIEDYLTHKYGNGKLNLKKTKKAISKIKSTQVDMIAEIQGAKLKFSTYHAAPNKMVREVKANGMTVSKEVFDGENGKRTTMQTGEMDMTEEEITELKGINVIEPVLNYLNEGYKIKLLSVEKIEGHNDQVYKVEITTPSGNKIIEYFSTNSMMRLRTVVTAQGPQGEVTKVSDYSDYKRVDGINVAHKQTEDLGMMILELIVEKAQFNPKVEANPFQ